mmetsp:Transcript_34433/g.114970  ORF Transcript_34433/g.114970 Transcript_34433/m.114970 type:complete len:366 (-) Transcript_34433:200-1297(-)
MPCCGRSVQRDVCEPSASRRTGGRVSPVGSQRELTSGSASSTLDDGEDDLSVRHTQLHVKARSEHPRYPRRVQVLDEHVPWSSSVEGYRPTDFVARSVLDNDRTVKEGGWADPTEPDREAIARRGSYEHEKRRLPVRFDELGRPLNPVGRTGMCNRGGLGKWGPNHAADPIVTRRCPDKPGTPLEVVVIKRRDTGEWAIPGGMVDAGELVSMTLRREFEEEAGNVPESERERFEDLAGRLFTEANGHEVYRGYVDDPRNTDNAWMETTAFHFHATGAAARLQLNAGGDAARAFWLPVSPSSKEYASMLADHRAWVDQAAATLHKGGGESKLASLASRPPPATSSQSAAQGLDARLKSLGQARGRQ